MNSPENPRGLPVVAWLYEGKRLDKRVQIEEPTGYTRNGAQPLVLATDYEKLLAERDELRAGIVRRGDDMIVPAKLLDEINASGAEWKRRAVQAELSLIQTQARRADRANELREFLQRCKVPGKDCLYCIKPSELDAALAEDGRGGRDG